MSARCAGLADAVLCRCVRGGGGWVGAVGVLRLAVCASVSLVRVLEKMSLGEYLGRRNYYHMDT